MVICYVEAFHTGNPDEMCDSKLVHELRFDIGSGEFGISVIVETSSRMFQVCLSSSDKDHRLLFSGKPCKMVVDRFSFFPHKRKIGTNILFIVLISYCCQSFEELYCMEMKLSGRVLKSGYKVVQKCENPCFGYLGREEISKPQS